jgi:sec-independent protein translocase protein TatA
MFHNPTTDLIVVLVIVLLFLGPKRLPGLGRSLGQGMREFKDGITGESKDEDQEKPAITHTSGLRAPPEPARQSPPPPPARARPRSVPSAAPRTRAGRPPCRRFSGQSATRIA